MPKIKNLDNQKIEKKFYLAKEDIEKLSEIANYYHRNQSDAVSLCIQTAYAVMKDKQQKLARDETLENYTKLFDEFTKSTVKEVESIREKMNEELIKVKTELETVSTQLSLANRSVGGMKKQIQMVWGKLDLPTMKAE